MTFNYGPPGVARAGRLSEVAAKFRLKATLFFKIQNRYENGLNF